LKTSEGGENDPFAKPLYGLTPVPRVRIPPSPPLPKIAAFGVGFALHFFLVVSIVVSMDTKALTPLKVLGRELGGDYEQSTHSELDEVGEDRR
jgi:hypothetical protein